MISIIGGGPVGGYLAYLLSSQGLDVQVFEEHKEIGRPVHCTGIVTSKFADIIKPKESFVLNRITKARIYSPNQEYVELRLGTNYVLDRAKLDQDIMKGAEQADAQLHTGHKFLGFKDGKLTLSHEGKTVETEADTVVGADGPLSPVAKSAGMFGERKFFTGAQARANLSNDNAIEFHLWPKGFGWVVPESRSVARIGIAAEEPPGELLTRFLESRLGEDYKSQTLEYQGGLIPFYNPKLQTQKGKVYLVGDAATMVKATTGGGIVPGLRAAEALAAALLKGKDYQEEWRARIGSELALSSRMRRLLDEFSVEELNQLIRLMNKENIRKAIETYDRDSLASLIPKLAFEALKHPQSIRFARHLLKRNLYI